MKKCSGLTLTGCGLAVLALTFAAGCGSASSGNENDVLDRFQNSLVELELSRKGYNYRMPWVTGRSQTKKNGIIIPGRRILTTADDVSGSVLVRAQKDGAARKYEASFVWVDYYANLAVLEVEDDEFWKDLEPARFVAEVPQSGLLHILRWRNGRLEARSAEIERLFVGKSQTSYVEHLQLEVTSEMDAAGWAEVVVQGNEVVGLTSSANGKSLKITPSPLIQDVLEGRSSEQNSGLGFFDFIWQPGTNPALLKSMGIPDTDHGILVTRVGIKRIAPEVLQRGDVIVEIAGFPIDIEGKYPDPEYGRLSFEHLATRNVMADAVLPMTLWRNGEKIEIDYTLPRAEFSADLVPDAEYDQAPEYLIAGGLIFQPVTGPYLSAFGNNPPFLLRYYDYQRPVKDRDGLVALSAVMPDPYNRGYEDSQQLIIDTVNDQMIADLHDLEAALEKPVDGFHRIQFFQDQPLRSIVLDAGTMALATGRVLERYRVPEDRRIHQDSETTGNP